MQKRCKPGAPNLAIGYLRVSTDEQALGPVAQAHALDTWAERHGVTLVAVFFDLGVSGAAGIADDGSVELEKRPGLLAALASLKDHKAGVLLVAKRDRLARDVTLAGVLGRIVSHAGARIVSAAGEGTELSQGDDGDDMRLLYDMFAQRERRLIRSRTKAALAVKSARGERVGTVPFGFHVAADGVKLERDAEEQAVIARILELRAAGNSEREIVAALEADGVVGRSKKPLAQAQVHRVLARNAASRSSVAA